MDVNPLSMEQFDRSVAQVKQIIQNPIFDKVDRIIGSGCGDSILVAAAIKGAFEHYLPQAEYEAVEAIELSRHYSYLPNMQNTLAIFISVSGGIYRTIEAMRQCRRHGITTLAITDNPDSQTAAEADILYYTNSPAGDNNAGLRTYYCNIVSGMILAAAIAEKQTGTPHIAQLRQTVKDYHDAFFANFEEMDDTCFAAAIHWMNKEYLEVVADGPLYWAGRFVQAKVVELSGDACVVVDSENFMHVNQLMGPPSAIGDMVLLNSDDGNVQSVVRAVNQMIQSGREVLLFSDICPQKLGIDGQVMYCHVEMPRGKWRFLAPLYAYLPASMFAGFRHTTIGEPMFRGGMDPNIFVPTYFSPIEVPEI